MFNIIRTRTLHAATPEIQILQCLPLTTFKIEMQKKILKKQLREKRKSEVGECFCGEWESK